MKVWDVLINSDNKMRHKYSEEDIEFLKLNYPMGNWKEINKRFHGVSNKAICSKMSKLGIKFDLSKKSTSQNTDYTKRKKWTEIEDETLKNNYSFIPIESILQLFPDRGKDSIINHASKLGIISYNKISSKWTKDQEKYIIDNWEIEPDKIMAEKLNKSFRAVKCKREMLGLYRRDMNRFSYPNLSKYLRGQNQKWKIESMANCNYKCVLSGSKNFDIHHQYGVSNIINDILEQNSYLKKDRIEDYSQDELNHLTHLFIEEQAKHPLGECVDKRIHKLFHSLYGQYYNTPEQWERFKNDYKKGIYLNID